MGAHWQPAQDELRAEDSERISLQRAVQRRQDEDAAGPHQRRDAREEGGHVRHVLDHLEQQHRIELCALSGDLLGGRDFICHIDDGSLSMGPRRRDVLSRRVNARHACAEAGQGLGDETAAAADVEDDESGQARCRLRVAGEGLAQPVAEIGEPKRRDAMQRPEGAVGVPPCVRQSDKAGDLLAVERCF